MVPEGFTASGELGNLNRLFSSLGARRLGVPSSMDIDLPASMASMLRPPVRRSLSRGPRWRAGLIGGPSVRIPAQ